MDLGLQGRWALVCAASKGLGKGCAKALVNEGVNVVITARGADTLNATAAELRALNPAVQVVAVAGDITTPEGRAAALAACPQVDILVNNAGVTRDGLILRMKDEDFWTVMDINLGVAFRLSRAAVKGMMKRRFGRIINISSVVGATGNPGQTNYVASKAGLIGLTKSLAQEVGSRGITVNAVAPGLVTSAISDKLNDEQKNRMLQNVPVGRIGEGADIAAAVVYLASTEASYVTGQTLHVNGGMAMI